MGGGGKEKTLDSGCRRSGSGGAVGDSNEHRRVGKFAIRGVWIPVSKQELRIGLFRRFDRHRRAHCFLPPRPRYSSTVTRAIPSRHARGSPRHARRPLSGRSVFSPLCRFCMPASPKYGQHPKNTEKSRVFVSFLTDLTDFPPYHRSRIRRYCSRKEQASPMRGAQHRNTWSVQTAPFFDGRCFL